MKPGLIDSKFFDCYAGPMGPFSARSLIILAVIVAFVHFGTPLIADLFFELYHLLKLDFLYSTYGVLRYATAQFMFSPNRWIVTLFVALLGLAFLWLLQKWRAKKEATT